MGRLGAARGDLVHVDVDERAAARADAAAPDRASPDSSRSSRSAPASGVSSPGSACPPGCSQRPSRAWCTQQHARARLGSSTQAEQVRWPGLELIARERRRACPRAAARSARALRRLPDASARGAPARPTPRRGSRRAGASPAADSARAQRLDALAVHAHVAVADARGRAHVDAVARPRCAGARGRRRSGRSGSSPRRGDSPARSSTIFVRGIAATAARTAAQSTPVARQRDTAPRGGPRRARGSKRSSACRDTAGACPAASSREACPRSRAPAASSAQPSRVESNVIGDPPVSCGAPDTPRSRPWRAAPTPRGARSDSRAGPLRGPRPARVAVGAIA